MEAFKNVCQARKMIAATSIALGLIAGALRSVIAYALISCLILAAFAGAVFASGGGALYLLLGVAILAFNSGIGLYLMGVAIVMARRQAIKD